jgi:hypothetical protein
MSVRDAARFIGCRRDNASGDASRDPMDETMVSRISPRPASNDVAISHSNFFAFDSTFIHSVYISINILKVSQYRSSSQLLHGLAPTHIF